MTKRQSKYLLYIMPLIPAALSIGVYHFPVLTHALQFDRKRVYVYEFYRFITCHVTHWNLRHMVVDTCVFLVMSYLCMMFSFNKSYSVFRYAIYLLIPSILITMAVIIFNHEIRFYRGLSAVDWALYAILMVQLYFARHWLWRTAAVAMFLLLCIFIAHQIITGNSMFVGNMGEGIVTMVSAHVIGAASGAACALIYQFIRIDPNRQDRPVCLRRINQGREDRR